MQHIWKIRELTSEERALSVDLSIALRINLKEAQMLAVRGIKTPEEAKAFVHPHLEQLHDPFLMKDMEKAVDRLCQAVDKNENILIYGDYDVDGTTAVSLVYAFLDEYFKSLGRTALLDYYIPDRYTEGYGISKQGIDYAKEKGCTLIIALDCGIKSIEKVDYAKNRGIDFIICDHHMPDGDKIPAAVAVLDNKRVDSTYPFSELSGCGVGFKLLQAFSLQRDIPTDTLYKYLPFLAMSIASDVVPILGENRILAYLGLKKINENPCIGLRCLIQSAGIIPGRVNISDLGFKIGPRINAAGRIQSGRAAVKLLITETEEDAQLVCNEINAYNTQRKELDTSITEVALEQLSADAENAEKKATVVCGEGWHKGVVGIVASRLMDTYYRPTIVLSLGEDGIVSGSARSAGGFDIYAAIDSCRDLLSNYGGHTYAAGLSMKSENYPLFKERFEAFVASHITTDQMTPSIEIEDEITFADITPQFFNIICALEPFGPGNPRPVFVSRGAKNSGKTKCCGAGQDHLKLDITDGSIKQNGERAYMSGIAFGKSEFCSAVYGNGVDLCYTLNENNFNGVTSIQLMVIDIKETH